MCFETHDMYEERSSYRFLFGFFRITRVILQQAQSRRVRKPYVTHCCMASEAQLGSCGNFQIDGKDLLLELQSMPLAALPTHVNRKRYPILKSLKKSTHAILNDASPSVTCLPPSISARLADASAASSLRPSIFLSDAADLCHQENWNLLLVQKK